LTSGMREWLEQQAVDLERAVGQRERMITGDAVNVAAHHRSGRP
jgi:hypothetical protein